MSLDVRRFDEIEKVVRDTRREFGDFRSTVLSRLSKLVPVVLSTTEIIAPYAGQLIVNATDNMLYEHNGAAWVGVTAFGGTTNAQRHEARYIQVSGQEHTLANATDTKLRYPTANTTCDDVTASGTGNTDFTANRGGVWRVEACMSYLANAGGGDRQMSIQLGSAINFANWVSRSSAPNVGGSSTTVYCAFEGRVPAGTVFCAIGWQNCGGSLSTDGFFGNSAHISLTWLRP